MNIKKGTLVLFWKNNKNLVQILRSFPYKAEIQL